MSGWRVELLTAKGWVQTFKYRDYAEALEAQGRLRHLYEGFVSETRIISVDDEEVPT